MCVYVCACMFVCVCVRACVYIYIYIYVCVCVCVCVFMCLYVCLLKIVDMKHNLYATQCHVDAVVHLSLSYVSVNANNVLTVLIPVYQNKNDQIL